MKKSQIVQIVSEVLVERGNNQLRSYTNKPGFVQKEYVEPASSEEVDPWELKTGTKHELEHTDDISKARVIALQHLAEDPRYYSKLLKSGIK
jgi:hypothetical protein